MAKRKSTKGQTTIDKTGHMSIRGLLYQWASTIKIFISTDRNVNNLFAKLVQYHTNLSVFCGNAAKLAILLDTCPNYMQFIGNSKLRQKWATCLLFAIYTLDIVFKSMYMYINCIIGFFLLYREDFESYWFCSVEMLQS
jgi:hypothetical protein